MCGDAVNRQEPSSWPSSTELWSDPTMPGAGCHGVQMQTRKEGQLSKQENLQLQSKPHLQHPERRCEQKKA